MKTTVAFLTVPLIWVLFACNMQEKETLPPLIDREVFFDDPVIAGGQLLPDGASRKV